MFKRFENLNFILTKSGDSYNFVEENLNVSEKFKNYTNFTKLLHTLIQSKINFASEEMTSKNLQNFSHLIVYLVKMMIQH